MPTIEAVHPLLRTSICFAVKALLLYSTRSFFSTSSALDAELVLFPSKYMCFGLQCLAVKESPHWDAWMWRG